MSNNALQQALLVAAKGVRSDIARGQKGGCPLCPLPHSSALKQEPPTPHNPAPTSPLRAKAQTAENSLVTASPPSWHPRWLPALPPWSSAQALLQPSCAQASSPVPAHCLLWPWCPDIQRPPGPCESPQEVYERVSLQDSISELGVLKEPMQLCKMLHLLFLTQLSIRGNCPPLGEADSSPTRLAPEEFFIAYQQQNVVEFLPPFLSHMHPICSNRDQQSRN